MELNSTFILYRDSGDIMEFKKYKDSIKKRLSKNFDITEDYRYNDLTFDMYAKYNLRNERYMVMKSATIYAFENNEHCFLKYFDSLDLFSLDRFIDVLKDLVQFHVKPDEEHMSSMITGIILTKGQIAQEILDKVKKFKYHKGFAFGLKGWVDIRLVLVCVGDEKVFTSKKAKKVGKFYQP